MPEKKLPKKRPSRVEKEAEALRDNLRKRKIQISERLELMKRKKDSDSSEN